MTERQLRALKSFSSVLRHLTEAVIRGIPELAHLREQLRIVVDAIHVEGANQHVARVRRYATNARAQVLVFRNNHMLALAKLVRPLFAGDSGMLSHLKVPHKRASPEEILEAADRMLKALKPHAKLLTRAKIDRQRMIVLGAEMRRLRKVVSEADAGGADRAAPTHRLKPLFARARELVIAIDGIQNSLRTPGDVESTEKLNQWKMVSRVGKKIGRPRKKRGVGSAAPVVSPVS